MWRGKPGSITGYSLRSLGDAWWGINWNADSTSARVIATIFLGWREGRERETERKGNRVENIERFSMEMVLILFERMKIDERRSKPSSSRLIIHLSHRLSRWLTVTSARPIIAAGNWNGKRIVLATKSSLDPPPVSKAFRRARENNPTNDIYVSKDPSTLLFSLSKVFFRSDSWQMKSRERKKETWNTVVVLLSCRLLIKIQ